MDVSRPYGVISHPLDSAALHVLVGTTMPMTGRQVARLAPEGSQQGIGKALNRLVVEGVVKRSEAGSAALYQLNREHLATPAIESLVDLRRELLGRLRHRFAEWKVPPFHASMFGSAARGDGDTASDIDLFIVRPQDVDEEDETWRGQLDELAEDVGQWTGNHTGIVELAAKELAALRRRRPPILKDLKEDAITLAGSDVAEILQGGV
jgi:predicted nucleotidyltransferase